MGLQRLDPRERLEALNVFEPEESRAGNERVGGGAGDAEPAGIGNIAAARDGGSETGGESIAAADGADGFDGDGMDFPKRMAVGDNRAFLAEGDDGPMRALPGHLNHR